MKLFDIFGKKGENDVAGNSREANDLKELEIYSGMRIIVENLEGNMLFIAKLQDPQRHTAKLHQYSEAESLPDTVSELPSDTAPISVKMRGYNDRERKAVFMEGTLTPSQKHIWKIENLVITGIENERSFPRMATDMDAVIISDGSGADERTCRLLNISVGGAGIGLEHRYYKGDKFLLKVKLLENRPPFVVYCEVLRVIQRETDSFEYGCRFLELTEADAEQITQNIAQMTESMKESSK